MECSEFERKVAFSVERCYNLIKETPGMYGETRILNLHRNIGNPILDDGRHAVL